MSRRLKIAGALALALALAAVTAGSIAQAGSGAAKVANGQKGCELQGQGTNLKHVIYLQFDNTHLFRDRTQFASDLELMPNLKNFLEDNGTLSDNEHTILISHTAGGILSSLTGLYPDRHGQAVSNSYGYFRPNGSVGFSSSFKYWTDLTDGGNPANSPPDASADPNFNMITGDNGAQNTPGPWVPWTRAGCDVGNVSTANAVLENNNSIILRTNPSATSLAAKRGPAKPYKTALDMPELANKEQRRAPTERKNCIHCHNIHDAENEYARKTGTLTREMLWRYPLPDNIGLHIDHNISNRSAFLFRRRSFWHLHIELVAAFKELRPINLFMKLHPSVTSKFLGNVTHQPTIGNVPIRFGVMISCYHAKLPVTITNPLQHSHELRPIVS